MLAEGAAGEREQGKGAAQAPKRVRVLVRAWVKMAPSTRLLLSLLEIFLLDLVVTGTSHETPGATFSFPEFPYKESAKNEAWFREQEASCEESSACAAVADSRIARTRCARQCLSPSCYRDIYESDELEEGEIDVRLNSFKGCFIQRSTRMRP